MRLLRLAVLALLALTAAAIFAALVALQARRMAERVDRARATVAEHQANDAESRRLAVISRNLEASNPELRTLLASEAVRLHSTPEAVSALRRSLFTALEPMLRVE